VETQNGERRISFLAREFRGSRFRCLLATSLPAPKLVTWMNSLVQPFAEVNEQDKHMPAGFSDPDEAKLGETLGFLDTGQVQDKQKAQALTEWWLAVPERANTPNWDFVSRCKVAGREGLILMEAKAHSGELKPDDSCGAKNQKNLGRISQAIEEASIALGSRWSLSADRCYQLSNRFAWAWKVASLGVPVVLVYLGFLNAVEMPKHFQDRGTWKDCLLKYANSCVPPNAWNSEILIDGTPLIPLIRSADVNVIAA